MPDRTHFHSFSMTFELAHAGFGLRIKHGLGEVIVHSIVYTRAAHKKSIYPSKSTNTKKRNKKGGNKEELLKPCPVWSKVVVFLFISGVASSGNKILSYDTVHCLKQIEYLQMHQYQRRFHRYDFCLDPFWRWSSARPNIHVAQLMSQTLWPTTAA
jgi:hypothetical protein